MTSRTSGFCSTSKKLLGIISISATILKKIRGSLLSLVIPTDLTLLAIILLMDLIKKLYNQLSKLLEKEKAISCELSVVLKTA